jgi:hypothetical protein
MARPTIPPAILTQRGVPITLVDGTSLSLCYTFRSLLAIEDQFGNLQRALDALDVVANKDAKAFGAINGLMAAGLAHEVVGPDQNMVTADNLPDYIDPAKIAEYGEAIGKAITAAFPKPDPAEDGHVGEETDADADPQVASPGLPGTTSLSSSGVGTPSGSGGQHLLSSPL